MSEHSSIYKVLGPIFAARMLLMIRKSQDPRTRSVVSTLIFKPVNVESDDTPGSEPNAGAAPTENVDQRAVPSTFRHAARSGDLEMEPMGRAV
jgi:hypothetical protein